MMNQLVYVRNNVIKGFGRGSKQLDCPTANVDGANDLELATGVYCGLAQVVIRNKDEIQEEPGFEETYKSLLDKLPYISPVKAMVCSHGFNPHFGNREKSLEVHLLDNFEFNFYGAELRVLICKRMRDEEKYNSLDELKDAIARDIRNAKKEVTSYAHHMENSSYFLKTNNSNNNNTSNVSPN